MCFTISYEHRDEKIAKKDIVCYKVVQKDLKPYFFDFDNFSYKIGKKVYAKERGKKLRKFKIHPSTTHIHFGIHSYSLYRIALEEKCFINQKSFSGINTIIIKCIIPKKTKYYYNQIFREYVSLSVIPIKIYGRSNDS